MIKLKTLRGDDYLRLAGGYKTHQGPDKKLKESGEPEKEDTLMLLLEMEEEPEFTKGKKIDFALGPLEGTQPCQHLDFSPVRLTLDF